MSDELSNATRIAALEDYNLRLLAENVRLSNEAAEVRETLESLRQSIYAACTGSGCLNAHELRVALDRERERCGVLERECELYRKYQASIDTCDCQGDGCEVCDDAYADWQQARKATDTRHALDAAKFDQHKRGSIIECLDKVRDAGGHAWDKVANPDAVLRGDDDDAAKFVADSRNACDETAMESAIVRALQAARSEAGRDGVVAGHMTRKAPAGHIIDDAGVVRKVLGPFYMTKDGVVAMPGSFVYAKWWNGTIAKGFVRHEVHGLETVCFVEMTTTTDDGRTIGVRTFLADCYSTREAAEAAKEAKA